MGRGLGRLVRWLGWFGRLVGAVSVAASECLQRLSRWVGAHEASGRGLGAQNALYPHPPL